MIRKFISFILWCRLENVMAVAFTVSLVIFFLTTRLFRTVSFGMLDLIFILLPVGILGLKSLLKLLVSSETDENADATGYLLSFFKPFLKIARDWFPFLLLCACYYSLYSNLVTRVNPHRADAFLARVDTFIVGQPPSFLLESFIRPWLTDCLYLIYFSHVVFFPGAALYFYLKQDERAFRRLMMGFLTIMLMGTASYILVPAVGPEVFYASQYVLDLRGHALVQSVDFIFRTGHVSFDCFPSLHVGIPLLLSFYLRDYCRKLFVPVLIYVAFMCFATVYLRYHYLIDVIAAFAYAPAAYWLNDFFLRHWPAERASRLAAEIEEKHPSPSRETAI
ncbi:MAG: phosphatase PAP2 family protein [Verrucomicrobiota bacterium]|jgi:membrane-associated phospholipid phosphatase